MRNKEDFSLFSERSYEEQGHSLASETLQVAFLLNPPTPFIGMGICTENKIIF